MNLSPLSPNSILFTWGDSGAFPLWYLHFIEGYRPDVLLLHTPHLASNWYLNDIADLKNSKLKQIPKKNRTPGLVVNTITKENLGFRKSYIDYSSKYSYKTGKMEFRPHGLIYKHTLNKKEPVDKTIWDKYVMRDIRDSAIVMDSDTSKAVSIYGFCRYDTGMALLEEGKRGEAINEFASAVKIVPGLKSIIRRKLFP